MAKNNQTPKIRFKGFNDPWEQRKLGTLVHFSKGIGYSKSDLSENGTPIVLYGRLYTKYETIIKDVDTFVEAKKGSVYSHGGEVIVPSSGETAEDISIASVVEKSGILLGGDLNIITPPENIDSTFLAISVSNGKPHDDMAKMAQGKSVVHLHNTDLEKIDLVYPCPDEQSQISTCFKHIDTLITLHQRKLEKIQNFKKAMLEKMFPKNGESIPKIRFSGFTSPWEQRKISELFKITRGCVLAATLTSEKQTKEMPFPVYSSQTKDKGLMGFYNDYLYQNSITWTTDGANAGTVNYRPGKFYCTNVCGVLLSDKIETNQMIAESLNKVAKYHVSYVGNPKLMNNVMSDIRIRIPKESKERDRISFILSQIDTLITLHQRKLEKLQNIKKSMLEKMFV